MNHLLASMFDEFVQAGMPEISVTQNWILDGTCTLLLVVDFFANGFQ